MPGEGNSVSGEVVNRTGEPQMADAPRIPGGGAGLGGFGLILLCAIVFLPGFFSLPPTDREARFAQASRQVLEAVSLPESQRQAAKHSVLVPRFQQDASVGHGPLGHWAQALSASVFSGGNPYRDSIWMYRVPSLVAAFVVLSMTRRLARSMFDAGAARLAVVLLALCPMMGWGARQAGPETMGAAWVMLGIAGLWTATAAATGERKGGLAFWAAVAGGVLTAGLVVPVVLLSAAAAVCMIQRSGHVVRSMRTIVGLAMTAAVVAGWLVLMRRHVAPEAVAIDMWHTLTGSDGWTPPGVHTVLAPLLLWPGSLLIFPGLVVAWKLRAQVPAYLLLVAWIVPGWLVFEVMPGKPAVMTLPVYPAMAILGARAILAAEAAALPGASTRATHPANVAWLFVGAGLAAVGLGLVAGRLILWPQSMIQTLLIGSFAALVAAVALRALRASWNGILKGNYARAAISGAGVMMLFVFLVPPFALPRWMGLAKEVGAELDRIDPSGSRAVASIGFESDALVFLTRGRLGHETKEGAIALLAADPSALIVRESSIALEGDRKVIGSASGLGFDRWTAIEIVIEEVSP